MENKYIHVKLKGCEVFITADEVNYLLQKDTHLFGQVLKRSKAILRHQKQKERENLM
jgi:hypothetical protein